MVDNKENGGGDGLKVFVNGDEGRGDGRIGAGGTSMERCEAWEVICNRWGI